MYVYVYVLYVCSCAVIFYVENAARLCCAHPVFQGAPIRYSGENPVKFCRNSGDFWWNSGEILAKRAKLQETHKKP